MRTTTVTDPGDPNIPNEDWVAATTSLVVVLDGATTRTETGCKHGTPWFVNQLGSALISDDRPTVALRDLLAGAIDHVASLHRHLCDLDHPGAPSAAVGLARNEGSSIDVLVLADVTVAVRSTSGGIDVLSDQRPDAVAADDLALATSFPAGHPARQEALREMKRRQLERRNQPGGYYVVGSDPAVADEAIAATIDATSTDALALLSDGAARIVELYGELTWAEFFNLVDRVGVAAIIDMARRIEASDGDASTWPRAKPQDDATIALCRSL